MHQISSAEITQIAPSQPIKQKKKLMRQIRKDLIEGGENFNIPQSFDMIAIPAGKTFDS